MIFGISRSQALFVLTIVVAFFLVGFFVYSSVFTADFVSWDDILLLRDNPNVSAMTPTTIKNVFTSYDPELYIPLTFITYQLNHVISGFHPAAYHVTNLFLHVVNALLVSWLLFLLIGRKWLALGLGMIFLLHPLNVESVAWISARKDVLSTIFFLLSLIAWIHYRGGEKRSVYVFSLLFFVLGLLSKVMIVTLPVILVLLDLLERRQFTKRSIVEKVPFFGFAILFGVIALLGKTTALVMTTTIEKILMACASTVFYLMKLILPIHLSVMYPYTKSITLTSPDFFVPLIIVVLFLILIGWLWTKSRILSFGLIFFLLTLIPTFINFAKGGDLYVASDRYAYIPMVGLLIVLGVLTDRWIRGIEHRRTYEFRRNIAMGVAAVLFVAYGSASFVQAATWQNSETLYKAVLRSYPNARAAHNNLGMEYLLQQMPDKALEEFDLSLAIKSDPKIKVNRGAALAAKGSANEAIQQYEEVIRLDATIPDSYYGIGNIYQKRGDLLRAAEFYRRALAVKPDYTNALNNLGAVYILLEDWDHAIETLTEAIRQKPDFVESYYNIAGAYEKKGMTKQAEEMYRKSIELLPDDPDALSSLAVLLYDRGDIDGAAKLLQKALTIQSHNQIAIDLVMRMKRDGVAK